MVAVVTGRMTVFAFLLLFLVILVYLVIIQGERRKKFFPIRRLPAMDASEEAVGRAVEMGRPIHYTPGTAVLTRMEAPQTLAALSILGYVAGLAARNGARIITTCQMPEVFPMVFEVVREAFIAEGKLDMFVEEDMIFLPQLKAAAGLMQREKVAANFLIGAFWHESLVLAEAGAAAGAINIGGVATMHQLPFLVACCDYCLIGEELFAASAYITKDPVMTSTIAGQDYIKFITLALIILGTLLSTLGLPQLRNLFG
jgi:hypothetical protein